MRNIKTKQYIQTLKTKDKRKNLAHFIKQQTISSKQNITASKEKNEHDTADQRRRKQDAEGDQPRTCFLCFHNAPQ